VDIVLPKWGMTMQDGVIAEWFVAVGDTVTEGQRIALIETEKVETELEAPEAGTIVELLYSPGDTAEVGAVIARMS